MGLVEAWWARDQVLRELAPKVASAIGGHVESMPSIWMVGELYGWRNLGVNSERFEFLEGNQVEFRFSFFFFVVSSY